MDDLEEIFADALEVPSEERGTFLVQRCGGDDALRARVEAMLCDAESADAFFQDLPLAQAEDGDRLVPETERYLPEGEIGRGGMAVVVKVQDRDLSRHLAMKVLKPPRFLIPPPEEETEGKATVSSPHARFLEEAQITAQLEHPGIVPVHELGQHEDGSVFFTMQLVRGRELDDVFNLARAGEEGWNVSRAVGVLVKACQAVAYAHDRGVVHRDLKPRNIMVGRFGEVYVMDWGLAKVQGKKDLHDVRLQETVSSVTSHRHDDSSAELQEALMTMDGAVVGTPALMAPEQAEGRVEAIDQRSDVYALGAILYTLLAGHVPYVKPGARVSSRTVLGMVIQGPPQPIREIDATAPLELVAICDKAMARDQSQRYPSSLELAEDLQAWIDGRVVKAYEQGAVAELRKWLGRNRALATSILTAVLLLVTGLIAIVLIQRSANQELASKNAALDTAQQTISQQLHDSQVNEAQLTFTKGLEVATNGDADHGMHWMLQALKILPESEDAAQTSVRRNLAAWSRHVPKLLLSLRDVGSKGAAVSSDGTRMAMSRGELLTFIDVATGEDLREPIAFPDQEIRQVDFHPTQALVAVALSSNADTWEAYNQPNKALILHADDGQQVGPALEHPTSVLQIWFCQDGDHAVTLDIDGTTLRRWELASGTVTHLKKSETRMFYHHLTKDRRHLFATYGKARPLLAADTLEEVSLLDLENGECTIAEHPAGPWLTGRALDAERSVLYWRKWGQEPLELISQSFYDRLSWSTISMLSFLPDGNLWNHQGLTALDLRTGTPLWSPLRDRSGYQIITTPSGRQGWLPWGYWELPRPLSLPATAREGNFNAVVVQYPRASSPPIGHHHELGIVRHRATAALAPLRSAAMRFRQLDDGFPRGRPLRVRGNAMWDAAVSPDGRLAATTVVNDLNDWKLTVGETHLWNVQTSRSLHGPLRPNVPIRSLAFRPDGKELAAGSGSSKIYFWNTETGEAGEPFEAGAVAVALTYSPDGTMLAAGFAPGQDLPPHTRLFDTVTHEPLGDPIPMSSTDWTMHLAFTPDNRTLVTGSRFGIAVLALPEREPRYPTITSSDGVVDVAISSDGTTLALVDGTLRVFDLLTGALRGRPMLTQGPIQTVALSADGAFAVTGTDSGIVQLWDVATSQPLGPAHAQPHAVWEVSFAEDGLSYLSTTQHGSTRRWPVPTPARGPVEALQTTLELWTRTAFIDGVPNQFLSNAPWQERRQRLAEDYEPGTVVLAEPLPTEAWHDGRARDAEADGDRWYEALWHLNQLLEAQPNQWQALARRGRVQVHRGEREAAEADFAKVQALAGEAALLDWFAHCAYDCREIYATWDEALYFLKRLRQAESDQWQWPADQAEALRELGRIEESQAAYVNALSLSDEPYVPEFAESMMAEGNWRTLYDEYARAEQVGWLSSVDWERWHQCAQELGEEAMASVQARWTARTNTP